MLEHPEVILKQALLLSPKDKVVLVEKLLASLDQPDSAKRKQGVLDDRATASEIETTDGY